MTTKEYYQEHKEEFKVKNKERYEKNKEKYLIKNKERYKEKREEILAKQRIWQREHAKERKEYYERQDKEKLAMKSKISRDILRKDVLNHYGNKCVCCGEDNSKFLTMDHINGGGNQHRKSLGGPSTAIYRWIKKNNYPNGFQILCYNCNCARAHNGGICPHKEMKSEV